MKVHFRTSYVIQKNVVQQNTLRRFLYENICFCSDALVALLPSSAIKHQIPYPWIPEIPTILTRVCNTHHGCLPPQNTFPQPGDLLRIHCRVLEEHLLEHQTFKVSLQNSPMTSPRTKQTTLQDRYCSIGIFIRPDLVVIALSFNRSFYSSQKVNPLEKATLTYINPENPGHLNKPSRLRDAHPKLQFYLYTPVFWLLLIIS